MDMVSWLFDRPTFSQRNIDASAAFRSRGFTQFDCRHLEVGDLGAAINFIQREQIGRRFDKMEGQKDRTRR